MWLSGEFFLRDTAGSPKRVSMDGSISPPRVANDIARLGSSCPLTAVLAIIVPWCQPDFQVRFSYRWPTYAIGKGPFELPLIFRFPPNLDKIMILIVMLRHTVFLCHTTWENKIQTLSFVFFRIRDCAIIIRRGVGQNMSFARRNITLYPPLNKAELALTPLQISQKLWRTHPSPPPNHHPQIQWNPDFSNPRFNEPPDISN